MQTVTVYGASDDLIEVEGALSEEFSPHNIFAEQSRDYLAFSDGTVLSVRYDDGAWRINRLCKGGATFTHAEADGGDSANYSDRVTLTGDALTWVVFGSELVRAVSRP